MGLGMRLCYVNVYNALIKAILQQPHLQALSYLSKVTVAQEKLLLVPALRFMQLLSVASTCTCTVHVYVHVFT